MKLMRFDGSRTGIVVELPSGIHVVDVVANVGALCPMDPISSGILNGILKDNGSWVPLIKHWRMVRVGLRALAASARANVPSVVVQRLDEVRPASSDCPDGILSLEIEECEEMASICQKDKEPTAEDERIVVLRNYRET